MRKADYEEAKRDFLVAQRFRPHDPELLHNLSFALFHLGSYDEAETMTRELLDDHPDSIPLLYNLGLILLKAGRDGEATAPLKRILALDPHHRKAGSTLGLIYQRSGDKPRSEEYLKQAGAELKVTSTEEQNEALKGPHRESAVAAPADGSTSSPPAPVVSRRPSILPADAEGSFSAKGGGFVTATTRRGIYVRRGVITARSGAPVFEDERRLSGPFERLLVKATGEGTLLLVEKGRRPHFLSLTEEFVSLDPTHLLGFDATLFYREDPAFEFRRQVTSSFLKLYGTGDVAVAVSAEPERLEVAAADPLTIAARSVLGYGGDLLPELLEDTDPLAQIGSGPVVRFSGTGFVLAEAG